jgi:hypothetical protein
MPTDETTQEESTDQPTEESTPDNLQEESQDQPSEVVEEDTSESEESTPDQPGEEDLITIDGKSYTQEEAKELLSKGEHFTYNMQQLRAREKELLTVQQPAQPVELTDEEKEIQEAQKTLRRYGVVTEDIVDAKLRDFQAKQSRQSEFSSFRQVHPEVNDFAAKMIEGAAHAWNLTYEEAYQQGWGGSEPPKKVVRKKTVGASRRATTPVSGKGGGVLTRADIAAMTPDEYKKRAGEIDQLIREGKLK